MKKLLCIALMMLLCAFNGMAEGTLETEADVLAPAVGADATEAPAALTEAQAPYDGAWLPFEDGFRLYLPRGWAAIELTEAQSDAGLFYRAGSDDGAMGIAVGYMSVRGLATVDDLARDFERAGYSAVTRFDLNGIPAIAFERVQDDYCGVAFFHPVYPDYALYVYFSPCASGDGEARQTGAALLASISPFQFMEGGLKNN